ncbi:TonB-dependent receptor domain-containing protein [Endozoicomonas ascidiicola]|uniref:TonB-dependent receptor domain-containing protein n=1 Tax=Endozoicomonas ascidiicola TaxID=1698521 RepID=UPI00083710E5|nr:TonB-dependent receptor [Endozoicomonas ascidiicola]
MQRFSGRHSVLFTAIMAAMPVAAEDSQYSSPLVFDQVVVTATKTENSLAEAPASISVVTSEDIMEQPAMSLNEMVEHAVGVESRKQGGRSGRETISIRGMDSSYTLIMVNGRKMNSSNAIIRGNDFDLSAIPKENIERIEIIRGPMSALYGSEALGGVVNIITKLPDNEWRTTINGDYSTPADGDGGNETMLGVNTGGALIEDELYMTLAVNKGDRDAWKPYDGSMKEATALEERDTLSMTGGLNWYINDNHALDLDISYTDDKRDGMASYSKGLQPSNQKVKRHNAAITHTGSWELGESQLRFYRDEVEIGEYDFELHNRDYITETNDTLDGSFSTDLGEHQLTVGGDYRKTKLDNTRDLKTSGKTDVTQKALFAQDEWLFADSWTMTFGGRLDHHEEFGSEFSPRVYLVHNVSNDLTVKGGVGKAFKAPSLLQLNDEYILDSCKGTCKIKGNPNLKPETSTSYELAANYQKNNWETEIALFRNDIDDLIARDLPDVIVAGQTYTYKNINKAKVQGIELGGRLALTKALSLNADYTYTDAKDETTGERLTERPRQNASIKVNRQTSEKLTTFARSSYIGNQKIDETLELGGYTLIDAGMNYAVSKNLKLRAGVTNLGNKSLSHEAEVLGYTEAPRTWYAGFTSSF